MELIGLMSAGGVAALVAIVVLAKKLGEANARVEKAEMDIRLYRNFLESVNEELPENLNNIRILLLSR